MGYFDSKICKNYKTLEMSTFLTNFKNHQNEILKLPNYCCNILVQNVPLYICFWLEDYYYFMQMGNRTRWAFDATKLPFKSDQNFFYMKLSIWIFYYMFKKKVWIMWYSIFNVQLKTITFFKCIVVLTCKNSPKKAFGYFLSHF